MSEELLPMPATSQMATEPDRRVRVRYTQHLKSYCQKGLGDLDQVWWMGSVRDISGNGIGIVLQHRFEPDTQLTLELENVASTESRSYQVRVVRIQPQPGGWLLGCIFERELTEEEVQGLL